MYNYHVDIIWKIDIVLLALSLALSFAIITSSLLNIYSRKRRKKALLNIKKDMVELILSGKAAGKNVCLPFASGTTPRQFIDIQSNRDREGVFFNDAEQKFFKVCFVNKKRLTRLEKIAVRWGNKWRRIEAIMCLGYSEEPSVLKIFPKLLRSRDADILYFSILALGQTKTDESAKMLLSVLKRNTPYRRKIVSLLEAFPRAISDQVIDLAEDKNPEVRLWALKLWS
ncbi:MAG: HEAT repeat domain-containing protein, partial [Candidatus Omnitrophota bacterium]